MICFYYMLSLIFMLNCFCMGNKNKNRVKQAVQRDRILPCQKELLKLVFQNLAHRCPENKLNQHNFMLFFPLTGLWGEKVFRLFTQGQAHFISFSQFYSGMNKITRGNFQDKASIIFNLIKEPFHRGIRHRQFLKMLYHYSKKQLKQIMANDGVFAHQSILPSNFQLSELFQEQVEIEHKSCEKIQEFKPMSSFQKAYQEIIQYGQKDQKTSIILQIAQKRCLVNHINLRSLTEQFVSHIFNQYGDQQTGELLEKDFKRWILGNRKFLQTFQAAFHEELWSYTLQQPTFIKYIEKQTPIKYFQDGETFELYMMLVQNVLFLSLGKNRKGDVYRIICLEGVNIHIQSCNSIQIKDVPGNLTKCQLIFSCENQVFEWLKLFSDFSKNYINTKYQIGQPIGQGRFSTVFKCFDKKQRTPCALKKINLSRLQPSEKAAIQAETQILKIVKYQDFVKHYQTVYSKQSIYIVMQYIFGQDLFEFVKRKKRLTQFEAAYIIGKIIQAVMHLHSLEIIHRDLKPQNIMIQYRLQTQSQSDEQLSPRKFRMPSFQSLKIIDFGYASYRSVFDSMENVPIVGTPNYIAPQIFQHQKPSFQNDIFAIGSILYFMLSGQFAFYSRCMTETVIKTRTGDYTMSGQIWETISDQAKDLVELMLKTDPKDRISLRESLNHPWFAYLSPKKKYVRKQSTDHE